MLLPLFAKIQSSFPTSKEQNNSLSADYKSCFCRIKKSMSDFSMQTWPSSVDGLLHYPESGY